MDADDCARIVEGVAAVLDLLAAGGDAVDDPAPIYELLAERCVFWVRGAATSAVGLTNPGIGSRRATVWPCPARAFPLASHRAAAAVPIYAGVT